MDFRSQKVRIVSSSVKPSSKTGGCKVLYLDFSSGRFIHHRVDDFLDGQFSLKYKPVNGDVLKKIRESCRSGSWVYLQLSEDEGEWIEAQFRT